MPINSSTFWIEINYTKTACICPNANVTSTKYSNFSIFRCFSFRFLSFFGFCGTSLFYSHFCDNEFLSVCVYLTAGVASHTCFLIEFFFFFFGLFRILSMNSHFIGGEIFFFAIIVLLLLSVCQFCAYFQLEIFYEHLHQYEITWSTTLSFDDSSSGFFSSLFFSFLFNSSRFIMIDAVKLCMTPYCHY